MNRKHLFTSVLVATLCLLTTILGLVMSGVTQSHASGTLTSRSHLAAHAQERPSVMKTRQSIAPNRLNQLPVVFHGDQVMQSSSITYAIFWEPPTLQDGTATHVSPTYNSLLQRYFGDIGGSGLYNNNVQYYDNSTGHIANISSLGGVWVDTSAYPASGCSDPSTPHGCLNDGQIRNEISNAISTNGWSAGLNHLFFVFTSWGEGSCNSLGCAFSGGSTPYCAYHSRLSQNFYADIPYAGTDLTACGVPKSPNNDFDADSAINLTSSEHMEAVTDPNGSQWYDSTGYEIGDKCAWHFGSLSLNGGNANVQWNGHYYLVQQEWSNANGKCLLQLGADPFLKGSLYVGSYGSYMEAFNTSDTSFRWNIAFGAAATLVGGLIYAGTSGNRYNYLYAVNPSSGRGIWSYQTGGSIDSPPTVVNGVVYASSEDGSIYALNSSNGATLWHYQTGVRITTPPKEGNGVVSVGLSNGSVYGLDAIHGDLLWKYQTGGISSSVEVASGVVYIGSSDDNLYALNAKNGALLWKYATGGSVQSSPTVANGIVYIGSSDDKVYAINVSNGTLIWSYQTGGSIPSAPMVSGRSVYFGSNDNYVYSLNANNGTLLWRYQTGAGIQSSATIVTGMVFIGSNDGYVYALHAKNGSLSQKYYLGNPVLSTPIVSLAGY